MLMMLAFAWFVGVIRATADAGLVGLVDDSSDG